MSIKRKSNRANFIALASLLLAVVIISITTNSAHAESSSTNASINVANTISLALSGGDLVINNLTPGNAADSNSITATVTSNSPYGFHLAATTGTSTGTDSLVNTADSNFTFTNLNTNKATLASFSDNTWGYSYSTDGTNWISGDYSQATTGYNGLPLDNNDSGATSTTLFNSDSYLGSKSVQFKIGAKSATTQAAGTYTNTVNFYAIANPGPQYMQDMNSVTLNQLLPNLHDTTTLYDKRDNQPYTVAKLADGKYWMTENLNLAGGTALSADDTNVSSDYISSFSTSNNLTKTGDTIVLPASSTSGFNDNNNNYSNVYNTGNKSNDCDGSGCYSYYSWDAATLGSGRTIATQNVDAPYSICPKGWKLPTSRNTSPFDATIATESDFYNLAISYGMSSSRWTQYTDNFINQAGPGTTANFLLAGQGDGNSIRNSGSDSWYWSSTSNTTSGNHALFFRFYSGYVGSNYNAVRYFGGSVRCLLNM